MNLFRFPITFAAALFVQPAVAAFESLPQRSAAIARGSALTYADLADLALAAPVVAHVRVASAIRLKDEQAAGVPSGYTRFYVEAEIVSLIKGADGLPTSIRYLADIPNDSAGRPAKLRRKTEYLLFAATVPGRPGELRLVARDARIGWDMASADRVRAILTEAAQADAPPHIVGIGKAFHVPGTLPGESETQIFLRTEDGRPVSLGILRRPGEQAAWAVALGEIVDEAAAAPAPDTLLWYSLACVLPRTLPRQSLDEAEPRHERAIRADYALVLSRLGPCARNRPSS